MKKSIIGTVIAIGCITVIVIASTLSVPTVTTVVKEVSEPDAVVELTVKIMNSPEFKEEMRTLATARALYQISKEKQDEAIELAQMATLSYQQSSNLSNKWIELQYASTTSIE